MCASSELGHLFNINTGKQHIIYRGELADLTKGGRERKCIYNIHIYYIPTIITCAYAYIYIYIFLRLYCTITASMIHVAYTVRCFVVRSVHNLPLPA